MNWLDWLIAVTIAFSTFQGFRLGLFASVARLAGILAGLGVAITYRHDLVEYLINRWDLGEKILPLVTGILRFWFPAVKTAPPATATGILSTTVPVLPYDLGQVGDYLARTIVSGILDAFGFLALFLAVVWSVNFVARLLTSVADACPLGPLNRLGGLLFGAARGLLLVIIVLTLMSPFQQPKSVPGLRPETPGVYPGGKAFGESKLLPYFYPYLEAIGWSLQQDADDSKPGIKENYLFDVGPQNEV